MLSGRLSWQQIPTVGDTLLPTFSDALERVVVPQPCESTHDRAVIQHVGHQMLARQQSGWDAAMGIGPVDASTKLPSRINAQMPNEVDVLLLNGTSAQLLFGSAAQMSGQRISALERLRRLEEAKTFLRAHLRAGPQPARMLLKAARTEGIATRMLHRAKDALGVKSERAGGYAAHGQWTWYPP